MNVIFSVNITVNYLFDYHEDISRHNYVRSNVIISFNDNTPPQISDIQFYYQSSNKN